jgi:hypothetical protein
VFDRNPTAFILGAGASWHYGYPTGADLVRKVIEKGKIVLTFCEQVARSPDDSVIVHVPQYLLETGKPSASLNDKKRLWAAGHDDVDSFIARLSNVNPLVIDYFLGMNPDLQSLGKLLITWALLECEALYRSEGGNINRREALSRSPHEDDRRRAKGLNLAYCDDNWYRFVTHKLINNCTTSADLLHNRINFITFNYDVSLEHHLFGALTSIDLFETRDIRHFLSSDDRFVHIYGKVRQNPFDDPPRISFPSRLAPRTTPPNPQRPDVIELFQEYKTALDAIYNASLDLRTIAPHEKLVNDHVKKARDALRNSNCVYILGYGFDENNSALLELSDILKLKSGSRKAVLFTNYGNLNLINKNASRVFFGRDDRLRATDYMILGDPTGDFLLERSTRDVYGALAFDLGAREEHLISSTLI